MAQNTAQLREAWKKFECNPVALVAIDFGPDRIRIAPGSEEAWRALATVLKAYHYNIRVDDTDSYCCRAIKGGTAKSLHSYGIALDVNWQTNPFKLTPDDRDVRYSSKPTQAERGQEVKLGVADTDMTQAMIQDVRAIRTKAGQRVFEWGGAWKDRKDAMHFELDVTPAELAAGIDWDSVKKPAVAPEDDEPDVGVLSDVDVSGQPNLPAPRGGQPMPSDEILRVLIAELTKESAANAPIAQPQSPPAQDTLQLVLGALLGKAVPNATGVPTAAPVLSPIDRMLGGEMMAGMKTPLAILAYAVLSVLQAVGTAGTATGTTATPTGQILTTLIGGFGALGVLGKFDRVVQLLGLMATKPPK